jgi:hypothetical protein
MAQQFMREVSRPAVVSENFSAHQRFFWCHKFPRSIYVVGEAETIRNSLSSYGYQGAISPKRREDRPVRAESPFEQGVIRLLVQMKFQRVAFCISAI